MQWIVDNRAWIFSGIGVVFLIGLYKLLFKRKKASISVSAKRVSTGNGSPAIIGSNNTQVVHQNNYSVSTPGQPTFESSVGGVPSGYSSNPSPSEIFEAIDELPPFQRARAINDYSGLKVAWPLEFYSLDREADDAFTFTAASSGRGLPLVRASITLSEYPELKILPAGTCIILIGKIHGLGTHLIYLREARIAFPNRP
jgi:hypothetical protein